MACKGILKTLMVISNSAIFLAGVMIVTSGVLLETNRKEVLGMLDELQDDLPELKRLGSAGYFLIAIGVILTVIGLLGCCGACYKNNCMLMTFFIIVFIIFVMEVAGAILVLHNQPEMEKLLNELRGKVAENIKHTYGQNDLLTDTWNEMMSLLNCCGYNNYTDFIGSQFVDQASLYPEFCCPEHSEACTYSKASSENVNGCFDVVVNMIKSKSSLLGGVATCVAGIEISAMAMSCILYNR